MERQTLGVALLVMGVVLVLLSLSADLIGLGISPGIGLRQWGGTILGVILGALGWFLRKGSTRPIFRKRRTILQKS